jgi:hypothetical protein
MTVVTSYATSEKNDLAIENRSDYKPQGVFWVKNNPG